MASHGFLANCSHCQRLVFPNHVLSSIFVIAVIHHFSWVGEHWFRDVQLVKLRCDLGGDLSPQILSHTRVFPLQ